MSMQPIIKREYVRVDDLEALARAAGVETTALVPSASVRGLTRGSNAHSAKKSVRLLRENGRVHAIELSCSCGERNVVELEYASDTPAKVQGGSN